MAKFSLGGSVQWAVVTGQPPPLAMADRNTERLIGSIRRECLDHFVVFGERMHQYSDLFRPPGAFLRHQCMLGFNLRQGQGSAGELLSGACS
jgi:hypothetical protein